MVNRSEAFKLITAGRLIDGRGGPPVQEGAVLIRGSKIVAVGPAKNVLPPEGATVETFDYRGKTVMPGMIDCHTHHNGFGDGRPERRWRRCPTRCSRCKRPATPETAYTPG